jgi:hypothetical protein
MFMNVNSVVGERIEKIGTFYPQCTLTVGSVLRIYAYCDVLCAHYSPQESVAHSSAAQTVDGDLRVRAPGFRSSAFSLLGATLRAQSIF